MSAVDLVMGKILTDMLEIDGVIGTIVVDKDGLVIESAMKKNLDREAIAGVLHELVSAIKLMGDQFGAGELREAILEFKNARMFTNPIGSDYYLIVIGDADLNLGRMKLELRKVLPKLEEMLY
ncbi:roadblock/LC7 domain-containing protein [Thermococcus sp. AM4]|uniref:roadblock/LC7 domain-containing protein n=1 Tax=Thermococcus sp. (strain AM4) TaxID=246969 RepID=UPI0001871371|nr:roadblock/LC7 domain-containing protein [Thermococcus sp. AM4]EEB73107.1 Roadblock/LC7 family protein [Thermococcus sp. AM4]